jgi:hypothetical protein
MYLDFVQQTNQSIETHKKFLAVWMELHIPVMAFPEKKCHNICLGTNMGIFSGLTQRGGPNGINNNPC